MFFRLFGNFLLEQKVLNEGQLEELMEYRSRNRVKLGVLAVEQGLMTLAQADEVNRLQALADKRFGDIAKEKGYLSEEDLEKMIQKQGNPYILFLQAVTEKNMLTRDDVHKHLEAYRKANSLSEEQLEAVKNGTIDDIADIFLHADNRYAEDIIRLAIRNLVRFIGNDLCFDRILAVPEFKNAHIAYQAITGSIPMFFGLACENMELLTVASVYAKETFTVLDADAYDSVCEFINCNNGLFARAHSTPDCEVELHPPVFKEDASFVGEIYLLPVQINGSEITLVVHIG